MNWPLCSDGKEAAFRVISSFFRLLLNAAAEREADLALIDVGPNLGAINRAAIIPADYIVVPLGPDLFSLQGLKNLGPVLGTWRKEWQGRRERNPVPELPLPEGHMRSVGYVVMQHAVRLDRPVKAYRRWIDRIPQVYRDSLLDRKIGAAPVPLVQDDEHCLSQLKHYRSLMPFAMEARKPMFSLKPADGAIGAHQEAVQTCYDDFSGLAKRILLRANVPEADIAAA